MTGPNSFRAERELRETGKFENDPHLGPFLSAVGICAVVMTAAYFFLKAFA